MATELVAAAPRLEWRVAKVVEVRQETPRARTLILDVPQWEGHRAGQHVDVRLVAEDGYQAQRSYSIASAPEDRTIALTIERLDDGEVSPYLCDVLHAGDGLEVRGPIGGYFVWGGEPGRVLLVGGGSGIVPLMAMVRHRARANPMMREDNPVRLIYSARTRDAVIYAEELDRLVASSGLDLTVTLTRETSAEWRGRRGRIDRAMLAGLIWPPEVSSQAFVCGPTPFVELVATLLVELGHDPARIRTERFGPTG